MHGRRTLLAVEPLECRALLSALSASLTTNQTAYQVGQPVEMTFTLTNTSNAPASFDYGPSFGGFIATQAGQAVWHSNDGVSSMIAILETLQPRATFTLHATWDGTTGNGLTSTTSTGQFVVTNQLDPSGASASFTIEAPLSYSLSTAQSVVQSGQTIGFSYSVTNTSDQPATFNLAPANFIVTGAALGETVWESDPGAPTQPAAIETLQPGQSMTETASWNGVANQGILAGTNVWERFDVAVASSPMTASEEFQIESPLSQSVTTDQTAYQPGEAVQLTATETNASGQAITILNNNDQFMMTGPGGVSLPGVSASSSNPIVTLQPGQSQTFTATWDPLASSGSTTSPTGSFAVLFEDNFQGTTSSEFVVEGPSTSPPLPPPGASSPDPPPSGGTSSTGQISSRFAVTLTTNHTTNPRRQPLEIKITLRNTARTSAKLAALRRSARLTVLEGSTVIWTKTLSTARSRTLEPGQSLRLTALWNGKPNQAGVKTMSPGPFTIEVDADGTLVSDEIRLE